MVHLTCIDTVNALGHCSGWLKAPATSPGNSSLFHGASLSPRCLDYDLAVRPTREPRGLLILAPKDILLDMTGDTGVTFL